MQMRGPAFSGALQAARLQACRMQGRKVPACMLRAKHSCRDDAVTQGQRSTILKPMQPLPVHLGSSGGCASIQACTVGPGASVTSPEANL